MDDVISMHTLSLGAAQRIVAAAMAAATSLGLAVCICVADVSGEPIATARMDGAPRMSAGIAANKAYSVAAFGGMPTDRWWSAIGNNPALVHGLTHTPRLVVFGGGLPVHVDGALVGAVGVSGGSAEQDREVAAAGVIAVSP